MAVRGTAELETVPSANGSNGSTIPLPRAGMVVGRWAKYRRQLLTVLVLISSDVLLALAVWQAAFVLRHFGTWSSLGDYGRHHLTQYYRLGRAACGAWSVPGSRAGPGRRATSANLCPARYPDYNLGFRFCFPSRGLTLTPATLCVVSGPSTAGACYSVLRKAGDDEGRVTPR
jgi:hypothetical protein